MTTLADLDLARQHHAVDDEYCRTKLRLVGEYAAELSGGAMPRGDANRCRARNSCACRCSMP
jgi:hypothetical protein